MSLLDRLHRLTFNDADEEKLPPAVRADVRSYLADRRTQFNHWFFFARVSLAGGLMCYLGMNAVVEAQALPPVLLLFGGYLLANATLYFFCDHTSAALPWLFAALDVGALKVLRHGFDLIGMADPNTGLTAAFALLLISYTIYGNPKLTISLSLAALITTSATLYFDPFQAAATIGTDPLHTFLLVEYLSIACLVTCLLTLRLHRQVVAYSAEMYRRMRASIRAANERAHRERAEELSQLKEDFIALLSHELRGPIAPLHTSLEFVQTEMQEGRYDAEMMAIAIESSETLERLIHDYTQLAELLTHDTSETLQRNVKLGAFLDTLVGETRRARLSISGLEDLSAASDPLLLRGALLAVLRRAELLTPEGQPIKVRGYTEAETTVLTVHDPASHLEPEMAQQLDDPFAPTEERMFFSANTGLELVLAQHALRRLGGYLAIEPRPKGTGTTIRCVLPAPEEALPWLLPSQIKSQFVLKPS